MLESIGEFLSIFVSRGGKYALLFFALMSFQVWRLDLLHGTAVTFLGVVCAWAVLWVLYTFRISGWVKVLPIVFLGWVTFEATLPGIASALTAQVRSLDTAIGRTVGEIDDAGTSAVSPAPEQVPTVNSDPGRVQLHRSREQVILDVRPQQEQHRPENVGQPKEDVFRPLTRQDGPPIIEGLRPAKRKQP
jgi:hypothetical protein